MTREEAVILLKAMIKYDCVTFPINAARVYVKALEMAIAALELEPCDVTVSKQAVLDLVVANHRELNGVNVVMYSPLCKDIKQLPFVIPQPSKDCVDRSSVELLTYRYLKEATDNHIAFYEELLDLPPVTPQPKIGRWIRVDKDKLKCSECEVIHLIAQYPNGKIDWCPNCGAKNQEVEE